MNNGLRLADLAEDPLIVPRESMISDLLQSMALQYGIQLRYGIDVKRGLACVPLDHDWARCDIYIATKGGTEAQTALSGLKDALLR